MTTYLPNSQDRELEEVVAGPARSVAWLVSLVVHALFLIVIGLTTTEIRKHLPTLILVSSPPEPVRVEEIVTTEFQASDRETVDVGASAMGGVWNQAVGGDLIPPSPAPPALELHQVDLAKVEYRDMVEATSGPEANLNMSVKGAAGVAVTGANGAVDRITQEILNSLEERPTLVVWFFDQSGSLSTQRDAIRQRFHRIYEELGIAQQRKEAVSAGASSQPLLAAIVAFGENVQFLTRQPTADVRELETAVAEIEQDESGQERVFTALQAALQRYKKFQTAQDRNLLFVVFSDESGNDQDQLDGTVDLLRRANIPVYVVGVPAPFGRKEAWVKWVDPDPAYDQTPVMAPVEQGPETLWPEVLQMHFSQGLAEDEAIDSGFGPFALTRLCYETGGIYFTVHPNRPEAGGRVRRGELAVYASYLHTFFDPVVMRRYRPDYVSAREYQRQVEESPLRTALVRAAQMSWLTPLQDPRQRFVFRNEGQFAQELTESQKVAARLEPMVNQLYDVLRQGEGHRSQEIVPRWQAGYDLAMGRTLAVKVRTETYNLMLAQAKQGLKFQDSKNNTWQLRPSEQVTVGSRLERDAASAREYLERVIREHPDTPWAYMAAREVGSPLSWEWQEEFTQLEPTPEMVASNNNNPPNAPQDDQVRMLPPPPKKRAPPKL